MDVRRGSLFHHLTVGAAFLLAACASKQEVPPQATSRLTQVRAQAVQLQQQVRRTTDSARTVSKSSGPELATSVNSFTGNVDSLNSTIAKGGQAVRAAQDQMTAFFANWDKQTRGMSEEMQKTSQQRQSEAAATLESLRASIGDLRTNLSPYVLDMNEAVKHLRTEQTVKGHDAASPLLRNAIATEPVIQRDLDEVIAKIDAIQGQ